MLTTIFSRVCDVKCRDLDRELAQSSWPNDRDLELEFTGDDARSLRLSSEEYELDNEGTPLDLVGGESTGATHNDSRDHTRQLMFSSRGPSFKVSEHLEKIDHIAIKLQAFEGSIWCILPASNDSTGAGAFKRDGILRGIYDKKNSDMEEEKTTIS